MITFLLNIPLFLESFQLLKPPCSLLLFQRPFPLGLFLPWLLPFPSSLLPLLPVPFLPLPTSPTFLSFLLPKRVLHGTKIHGFRIPFSPSPSPSPPPHSPVLSLLLSLAFVAPCQCSCPIQPLMLLCYLWHQLTGSTGLKLELFHLHLLSFVLQYGYPGGHSAASQY